MYANRIKDEPADASGCLGTLTAQSADAWPLPRWAQISVCCTLYALQAQHTPSRPKGPPGKIDFS
jgi:hypothetical protein